MSIETMTKLATVTVGAGGSANVTFSNIPQTYTDLRIVYSSRDTNANSGNAFANINLTINGDSLTNYSSLLLYGLGTSVGYSNLPSASGIGVLYHPSSSATSSTFSSNEVNFLDYSGSNHKIIISDGNALTNSTSPFNYLTVGKWTNTSAITSINLQSMTLFNQHSTFTLYGIKNVAKTAGNSVKAIGGNISFDGTYVYHTFNSSGTFTPTSNLIGSSLVVAGGGAGGGTSAGGGDGGGGGAGGISYLASSTFLANSNYSVIIGAGGSGVTGTRGNNGSDSLFNGITSIGGGGGGGNGSSGNNGGSGGGGGANFAAGGSATQGSSGGAIGYGNNGGSSSAWAYNISGGGGAGGVGVSGNAASGTSTIAPNGGIGLNTWASWLGRTGADGYLGGGGAGGKDSTVAGAAGIGGLGGGGNGGVGTGSISPQAGMPNTGGGGGGGGGNPSQNGAAGGSGIVIIRYKG